MEKESIQNQKRDQLRSCVGSEKTQGDEDEGVGVVDYGGVMVEYR